MYRTYQKLGQLRSAAPCICPSARRVSIWQTSQLTSPGLSFLWWDERRLLGIIVIVNATPCIGVLRIDFSFHLRLSLYVWLCFHFFWHRFGFHLRFKANRVHFQSLKKIRLVKLIFDWHELSLEINLKIKVQFVLFRVRRLKSYILVLENLLQLILGKAS